jgi:uncharacterized protein YodC (DUF2158 family)
MDLRRGKFPNNQLVSVQLPATPVVLKSGGPVMSLGCVEGGYAYVSWTDDNGRVQRHRFPSECLLSCVPLVTEPV